MNKIVNSLEELEAGSRICIYGAGEGGAALEKIIRTTRVDIEIVCFIDDVRQGALGAIPIIPLQRLSSFSVSEENIFVASAYWRDIERKLTQNNIFRYRMVHPALFFPKHIFTAQEAEQYAASFQQIKNLLDDESDRALYGEIIANRMSGLFQSEDPAGFFKLHYHKGDSTPYLDFVSKKKITTIIEGGVLDGKNTLEYLSFLPKTGSLYGFEPFYEVYENSPMKVLIEKSGNAKIYPLALWRSCGEVLFFRNYNNKDGSQIVSIADKNSHRVKAISIDAFVKEQKIKKVDYIKLDIEGAELDALEGADDTLKTHRPQLAVCIYHRKKDIFDIPLFLKSRLTDYVFKLGHYTSSFWDSVLYAIPEEIYGAP